ncbi:MAG TPA: hypothetical protein GXX72_06295 [Clostridiaceae bacterium]|nr:hypothetical protein [Clostridiaceae bacterium]
MSKEWMPPGGPFAGTYKKGRDWLRPLIIVVILIIVAVVFLVLHNSAKRQRSGYEEAVANSDFDSLMDHYYAAREIAFDNAKSSALREQNLSRVEEIEGLVRVRTRTIIEKIKQENTLSAEDEQFLLTTDVISTELLAGFLADQSIAYVKGELSVSGFVDQLNTLQRLEKLCPIIKPIADSLGELEEAQEDVAEAERAVAAGNWSLAFSTWEQLLEGEPLVTVVKYVERRRKEVSATAYADYHENISQCVKYGRFHTAYQLLQEAMALFPDDQDFIAWYNQCSDYATIKLKSWNRAIEHIAIRPLIVNPARAFDGDKYAKRADALMITADEFQSILEQLLANDYVLVAGDSFVTDEGKHQVISIPEGKKPLVLVVESFSYSPLRAESGTAECLEMSASGEVVGVVSDPESGERQLLESGSVVGILNAFCQEHPEFSFDGAKATLALTANRGIFGHPYSTASLDNWNAERKLLGLEPLLLSQDELAANQVKIREIAGKLRDEGYTLASYTWGGINIRTNNVDAIASDLKSWREDVEPLLGPIKIFHYPHGDHVFSDRTRLSLLTDAGFRLLSGYGDKIYMAAGKNHLHTDKVYVGGDELRRPRRQKLNRFFAADRVLSDLRP